MVLKKRTQEKTPKIGPKIKKKPHICGSSHWWRRGELNPMPTPILLDFSGVVENLVERFFKNP